MKTNVKRPAKKQKEPVVMPEIITNEWWAMRSKWEKVFVYGIAELMRKLKEGGEIRIQSKDERISVRASRKTKAGKTTAETLSITAKEFWPPLDDSGMSEMWYDFAMDQQQRILKVTRALVGSRSAALRN